MEADDSLFGCLGKAFFSPLVPSDITDLWSRYGGQTFSISSNSSPSNQVSIQHEQTLQEDENLSILDLIIKNANYIFLIDNDPLFENFNRNTVLPFHCNWINDCVEVGYLVILSDYILSPPKQPKCQLKRLDPEAETISQIKIDFNHSRILYPPPSPFTQTYPHPYPSHQDMKTAHFQRKARSSKKIKYLYTPYLTLDTKPKSLYVPKPRNQIPSSPRTPSPASQINHSTADGRSPLQVIGTNRPNRTSSLVNRISSARKSTSRIDPDVTDLEGKSFFLDACLPSGLDWNEMTELEQEEFIITTLKAVNRQMGELTMGRKGASVLEENAVIEVEEEGKVMHMTDEAESSKASTVQVGKRRYADQNVALDIKKMRRFP